MYSHTIKKSPTFLNRKSGLISFCGSRHSGCWFANNNSFNVRIESLASSTLLLASVKLAAAVFPASALAADLQRVLQEPVEHRKVKSLE
jgi:hypothetical protein